MDFMRLLRSLEEFLYEVMTWLVFYPRTFLRTALHPIRTLEYSRSEIKKPEESQYLDALSAPLFLILTLLISHFIELGAHLHPSFEAGGLSERLYRSDQNLIIVRSLMFAIFPLMFALEQVKSSQLELNRKTLRGPFYGECFPAAVFCLAFGVGGTIAQVKLAHPALGGTVMAAAAGWYLVLQTIWLRRLKATWLRAALVACACFLKAAAMILAAAAAIAFTK